MTAPRGAPENAVRPEIRALRAYELEPESAPPLRAKLDFNESPFDVPEEMKRVVLERLAARTWGHYPAFGSARLRASLARVAGRPPEEIVLGNGSGEAVLAAVSIFAGGGRLALARPTFSLYDQIATIAGARIVAVPRRGATFDVDEEALLDEAAAGAVPLLCSPNNPTGGTTSLRFVERLAAVAPVVLLDQAYQDFADPSGDALPLLASLPNLVVFRTLSKAYSAAGFRIGYAAAPEPLAREIRKAILPFNVGLAPEELAVALLERPATARAMVATVVAERGRLAAGLEALGFAVAPSAANFLFVAPPGDAVSLRTSLLDRGILVRDMTSAAPNRLRITVGSSEQNDMVLATLKEIL